MNVIYIGRAAANTINVRTFILMYAQVIILIADKDYIDERTYAHMLR